jgi:hypothetical protein
MSENVNIRVESTLVEMEVDTKFLLKLPEYKTEIIIRSEYVPELIEKLTLLNTEKK